jgi:hypothetical protein
MKTELRADGIKLSLEMDLITIRSSSSDDDPNARFVKLMGENRINLPFLCIAARGDIVSGTYCILTEDKSRAKSAVALDSNLTAQVNYLPSVGGISVFPHNFNLLFLGTMLSLLSESGAPLHGMATSISALTMITDFSRLQRTANYLAAHVSLPGNHSPFNPDMRINSI